MVDGHLRPAALQVLLARCHRGVIDRIISSDPANVVPYATSIAQGVAFTHAPMTGLRNGRVRLKQRERKRAVKGKETPKMATSNPFCFLFFLLHHRRFMLMGEAITVVLEVGGGASNSQSKQKSRLFSPGLHYIPLLPRRNESRTKSVSTHGERESERA